MKKLIISAITGVVALTAMANEVRFEGCRVITVKPEASTGLENIYVVDTAAGATISYVSDSGNVEWLRFRESGGGFADEVSGIVESGNTSSLGNFEADCGYIITDGGRQHCYWIVDYSKHEFSLNGISFADEQDCGTATLLIDGSGAAIQYYTINGVPKQLSRQIAVTYDSQEWNEADLEYKTVEQSKTLDAIGARLVVAAPLTNTTFTISGDRFSTEWGRGVSVTSDTYTALAVDANTTATQTERDSDNEQRTDSESLGGSAPAEITFKAYCSDAVEYREWQFSADPEFNDVSVSMKDDEITYTFTEQGTTYVRFLAANADGTCTTESEPYQVTIGESALECPNAFSPDASEGINDVWKVSYKSLTSFKCWIFDRYGVEMCHFEDPSQGWDGKYKGKYVKSGVYFYVIEATGSDGKKYKKKGDINILKSKNNNTTSNEGTE